MNGQGRERGQFEGRANVSCPKCRFEWFHLRDSDHPDKQGMVVVNTEGHVAGYSGDLVCARCGEVLIEAPKYTPPPDLRVVP